MYLLVLLVFRKLVQLSSEAVLGQSSGEIQPCSIAQKIFFSSLFHREKKSN